MWSAAVCDGLSAERVTGGVIVVLPIAAAQREGIPVTTANEHIDRWLQAAVDSTTVSDVHINAGSPVYLRRDHHMVALTNGPVPAGHCHALLTRLVPDRLQQALQQGHEVDFVHVTAAGHRFRFSVFDSLTGLGATARHIRHAPPNVYELQLPAQVAQAAMKRRGLVIVAGPARSGKSTTLAAMIELINESAPVHVVSLEDPIEYVHTNKKALIRQREVGTHTQSFHSGIRAAMRQDPDVVVVGECRDAETALAALSVAETGHLVLTTVHSQDVAEVINRFLSFFDAAQRGAARAMLACTLQAVICQRLIPRADGHGLVAATEIGMSSPTVVEAVSDPDKTHHLRDLVASSAIAGSHSFDQDLLRLVREQAITAQAAIAHASNPSNLDLTLRQAGIAYTHPSPAGLPIDARTPSPSVL